MCKSDQKHSNQKYVLNTWTISTSNILLSFLFNYVMDLLFPPKSTFICKKTQHIIICPHANPIAVMIKNGQNWWEMCSNENRKINFEDYLWKRVNFFFFFWNDYRLRLFHWWRKLYYLYGCACSASFRRIHAFFFCLHLKTRNIVW